MCYIPSSETQRKSARLGENFCCAITSDWEHAAAIAHGLLGMVFVSNSTSKFITLKASNMKRDTFCCFIQY